MNPQLPSPNKLLAPIDPHLIHFQPTNQTFHFQMSFSPNWLPLVAFATSNQHLNTLNSATIPRCWPLSSI